MARERTGCKLRIVPVTEKGELDTSKFDELLSKKTKLVALNHVSNTLGTINPAKELIEKAHKKKIPVLLDGAQAVPHMAVDVQELDVDLYAFSGHKMFGPTGIGVLYGKEEWLDEMPPFQGGGEMIDRVTFDKTTYAGLPNKFEAGTPPIAQGVAMAPTVDYIQSIGYDAIRAHEEELLALATERLRAIEGLEIIGDNEDKAAVISFIVNGTHPSDIGVLLDQMGIAVRTGHHCTQPLMDRFGIPGTARASFAFYNNHEDVERLVDGVKKAVKMLG
jgi:cysteine desulfurase/selenocysteine lyase